MEETFKDRIFNTIGFGIEPERADIITEDLYKLFTDFIYWLNQPKCPFSVHWDNWEFKDKKISFDRLSGNYTLNDVMNYYVKNVLK